MDFQTTIAIGFYTDYETESLRSKLDTLIKFFSMKRELFDKHYTVLKDSSPQKMDDFIKELQDLMGKVNSLGEDFEFEDLGVLEIGNDLEDGELEFENSISFSEDSLICQLTTDIFYASEVEISNPFEDTLSITINDIDEDYREW